MTNLVKISIMFLASACLIFLVLGLPQTIHIVRAQELGAQVVDHAILSVNCTSAQGVAMSTVTSDNASLVHFPIGADMTNPALLSATSVDLIFSSTESFLFFLFNTTDETAAAGFADSMLQPISTAFSTEFVWASTDLSDGSTNVTYIGESKSNLTLYAEGLMQQCLISDIGGFSLSFLPVTTKAGSIMAASVAKDSGNFNWTYSMMTTYIESFAMGSGNHTIDILDTFGVTALAPSAYAKSAVAYASTVAVTVSSDTSVTFASSQPAVDFPPARGWFVIPSSPNALQATFYFGNDASPQAPLTLTFSGIVIPEFETAPLLSVFMLIAATALIFRRQFLNRSTCTPRYRSENAR